MKIAGLDIGTTGCKCTVFDEKGRIIDKAHREYPARRDITGHEIDMELVRTSALETVTEVARRCPDIAGIGVTSFGETFALTDEKGKVLHISMLYTDPRGHEECKELVEQLGERHIAEITGLRPHAMYSLGKLMWFKRRHPDIYAAASHIFMPQDLIVFALTGTAQIDYSLATRSMAFDINALDWSDELLEAAGADRTLYSKPVPGGTSAGKILPEIAEKTGLSPDTVVVSVGQDQVAATVGAGVFDGSVAVDGAGTVECIVPVYESRPSTDTMYDGYYVTVPYVVPGSYVTYAFNYTGGALTEWCTEALAGAEMKEAEARGISVNRYLEEQYAEKMRRLGLPEDEPSGLLVLPHFAGAATPYMDIGSRGAILGLTTDTSAAEIYRGCLEGVAYEMYVNYKRLLATGVRFDRLQATGGGAHSEVWMQIKADVLNLPIVALKTVEAGTVGCAMMTGIAVGLFRDLNEAASVMVEKTAVYEPRPEQHAKYEKIFERYEKVYDAVRPLMA